VDITVPPPQPGDRVITAVAHALAHVPSIGRYVLSVAIIAAYHPGLSASEAARIAADLADERTITAGVMADTLLAEASAAPAEEVAAR